MNAFGNKKHSMIAFVMAFVLVSAAFLGLAMIPGAMAIEGDRGNPIWDIAIGATLDIDTDYVYNTSIDQNIALTMGWTNPIPTDGHLSEVMLNITDGGDYDENLYTWNLTTDGGVPDTAGVYIFDGSLAPGDYYFAFGALFWNETDQVYSVDVTMETLSVLDGTNAMSSITGVPMDIPNDDSVDVNITLNLNRLFTELDIENMDVRIWHEDSMTWTDLEMEEPAPENLTLDPMAHTSVGWTHLDIPFDTPVGEYKMMFQLLDLWGYEEVWNETLFHVVWREMAPEMTDGMVSFDEDMYAVVDLEDHFNDVNDQTLTYWFNETLLDNLMVVWEGNMLNFTALMDWNGEEMFTIWVSDGVANVSFDMTITVDPIEDDLKVAMDTTILVDEDVMMAAFDALDLFYDPDGPVDNLAVSLGEMEDNSTGNITMVPVWMYEDDNITIMINETDPANSKAMVNVDVETGRWSFPILAWIDGNVTGDEEMAYVEIVPINDVPMLNMDMVTVYKNEMMTINLSEYFTDADGPMLNLTVNTTVSGALLTYDWETFMLTINPATNWTGGIDVEINATDGEDFGVYTLVLDVRPRTYTVTGTIDFAGVEVNTSMVTLTIGGMEVGLDENGTFSVTKDQAEYNVELEVPAMYLYNETNEQSGLEIPMLDNLVLDGDVIYDITLTHKEYVSPVPVATWANINFTTKEVKDVDGTIEITIGVTNDTYTGYGDITVQLIIKDDEDEYMFNMTWDAEMKKYVLELDGDDLEDVPEGDKKYSFTDGTEVSDEFEYEFREKDENANLITVIVLIVLIILVLIALVFIMRKPSEEEFDEEDEEEEEEGERSCPSCGETVTDEEAGECPYCGEDLEE